MPSMIFEENQNNDSKTQDEATQTNPVIMFDDTLVPVLASVTDPNDGNPLGIKIFLYWGGPTHSIDCICCAAAYQFNPKMHTFKTWNLHKDEQI